MAQDEIILTPQGRLELEDELWRREHELHDEIGEQLRTARGFGDLSENAEYDEAKAEEARVYGRIAEIENTLRTATFVDDSDVSTDVVSVGTVVDVLDVEYDERDEYTIVGFTEADPSKLFISQESPIGAALLGAQVGQIVDVQTPGGLLKLKVMGIRSR